MSESLYEKIGGELGVNKVVDIFYSKMLTDARVAKFFENIDMKQQTIKQRQFFTMLFGGAQNYTGKNMRESHDKFKNKLTDAHVDALIEHLSSTLQEMNADNDDVKQVITMVNRLRSDVLNRPVPA